MILLLDILYHFLTLSLIAVGLSIAFGLLRVINMAHGEMVILGAYCALFCHQQNIPFGLSLPFAIIICSSVSAIIYFLVIRKIQTRMIDSILATWGVAIVIKQLLMLVFTPAAQHIPLPITTSIQYTDFQYPVYRVVVMLISILVLFISYYIFFKTHFGLASRAVINHPNLASCMGVNQSKINFISFCISGAMAGIAGAMIAPLISFAPISGKDYLIPSFLSVLLGGLESIIYPIWGALILSITETSSSLYISPVLAQITTLIAAIILLKLFPRGIASFFKRIIDKNTLFNRQKHKKR